MVLNKKFLFRALIVLVILLGILATGQIDYNVSKTIINRHSIWAEFFNMFGEMPANLGLLIGTGMLYGSRMRESKLKNIISTVVSLPLMLLFSLLSVFMPFRYFYEFAEGGIPKQLNIVILILGIVLFGFVLAVINRVGQEKLKKCKKIAIVLILLVVSEIIVVNVLKIVWGRPRMRSIESIEQFKYWFQINGPAAGEEFKSFPSGHTANGFVMLAYCMFVPYFKKINPKVFMGFAITWGSLVALSRVVLGAHFLSDVLVGGYVTVLLFYVLNRLFFKKVELGKDEFETIK